jgi:ribonuclease R
VALRGGAGFGGPAAEFEGEIVGVIGSGAFIAFGDRFQYEGMLPVRRMTGDWWELNEQATALIGTRNGDALKLGDSIAVKVDGIDTARGRVDLVPAGGDEQ